MLSINEVVEAERTRLETITGVPVDLFGAVNQLNEVNESHGVLTYELDPTQADDQTHYVTIDLTVYISSDFVDYELALLKDNWEAGQMVFDDQNNQAATWNKSILMVV